MRDKQPVLAVLGVLAVVVIFIWGANIVTAPKPVQSDPTTTAAVTEPTDTASSTATPTPTPTVTPSLLAGCTPLPPPATTTQRMTSAPDIEGARGRTFVATITTNCGPVTVELDGAKAPATVSSFILLAKENYWAGSPCHRLTGDAEGLWVLQCGDPTGTGSGPGPGYHFGIENAPPDGKYPAGTLAMARTSDPNSNGDQFFIVYRETTLPTEGGGYTIFGKVTGGMDLIDKIAAAGIDPSDGMTPLAPIGINSVTVKPKA